MTLSGWARVAIVVAGIWIALSGFLILQANQGIEAKRAFLESLPVPPPRDNRVLSADELLESMQSPDLPAKVEAENDRFNYGLAQAEVRSAEKSRRTLLIFLVSIPLALIAITLVLRWVLAGFAKPS